MVPVSIPGCSEPSGLIFIQDLSEALKLHSFSLSPSYCDGGAGALERGTNISVSCLGDSKSKEGRRGVRCGGGG